MSDLVTKLWSILTNQAALNSPTIFSYETMASCYFEFCSFYSNLFFIPDSLLVNSTKHMRTLLDMIEQISGLASQNINSQADDSSSQLLSVRLKFLNNLLNDDRLFEISNKNIQNFQFKLINLLVYAYLSSGSNQVDAEKNDAIMENKSSTSIDRELESYLSLLFKRVAIFEELKLKDSSNLEKFLEEFIVKFSLRLKQIQVF